MGVTMRNKKILITLLIIFMAFNVSLSESTTKKSSSKWKKHIELSIPTDSDSSDDFLIKRTKYVVSYNSENNVDKNVQYVIESKVYKESEK